MIEAVGAAGAALLGALLGAGAALHAAQRQREADRSLAIADAVGQLCAALSAAYYRASIFRARFPRLGGLLNAPSMSATAHFFDSFANDLAVAVREHSRSIVVSDRQVMIDAAHEALNAMHDIGDLATGEQPLTPDDWQRALARLGAAQLDLKRQVRLGFHTVDLRIVPPQ